MWLQLPEANNQNAGRKRLGECSEREFLLDFICWHIAKGRRGVVRALAPVSQRALSEHTSCLRSPSAQLELSPQTLNPITVR